MKFEKLHFGFVKFKTFERQLMFFVYILSTFPAVFVNSFS